MNAKTAKLISPERVAQLLDCYGANPKAWPEDERSTALALIQHSSELKQLQLDAQQLDQFLSAGDSQGVMQARADSKLVAAIVSDLPQQEEAVHLGSHSTGSQSSRSIFSSGNWLGMIAASVAVFVISVSILELKPATAPQTQLNLSQQELDYWMWEQVTGESVGEDEEPLTMLTLLELEEL